MMRHAAAGLALVCATGAQEVSADALAFFDRGRESERPLVPAATSADARGAGGSLFAGRNGGSLFAPWPDRPDRAEPAARATEAPAVLWRGGGGASDADRIRHMIARAEAGRDGYDAVQHGARVRPPRRPTEMRVQDIYDWIRATPGQPHAIGRYQFIPPTLRRLVREEGVDPSARFSPDLQDRLADRLLAEAGLQDLRAGKLGRRAFMVNLAGIWAGLPLPSGKSRYHGYAGNKATMTWAAYEAEMSSIFPG